MTFKVFNTLFLTAYLLSAIVQYNDPDAPRWVVMYLAAASMCIAAYRDTGARAMGIILLLFSVVWMALLLPQLSEFSWSDIFDSVSMKTKAVEEAREIGGLALIAIWSAVQTVRSTK